MKSAMREKDRRRARERRLATFSQGEWQIYSAFHCCNLYKAGIVDGPVAQGIEQQPSKLKVAGSNPAGVASKFNSLSEISPGIASQKSVSGSVWETNNRSKEFGAAK